MLLRGLQEQLQRAAKESSSNASMSNFSLAKVLTVCQEPTRDKRRAKALGRSQLHCTPLCSALYGCHAVAAVMLGGGWG